MYLGRVVGCVWSTIKNRNLEGQRMLVIQPLTPELQDRAEGGAKPPGGTTA